MVRINPDRLMATTLGAVSLYAATGKKIPEPLLLFSVAVTVIGFINAAADTVTFEEKETVTETMAGLGNCQCQQKPPVNNYIHW